MSKPVFALSAALAVALCFWTPGVVFARGGGGGGFGGGGHGGGGRFGGGHFAGGGGWAGHSYGGGGWGGRGYGWGCWGGRGDYGWGRGYGWRGGYWGYPYGYGLGLGLGLGLGYGLGYGYGPWGYGGWGYAYPAYGYGYYGYDPYGAGTGAYYYAGNPAADPGAVAAPPKASSATTGSSAGKNAAAAPAPSAQEFVEKGETAFRNGDYAGAAHALRHAVVDDPQNGVVTLLLAQALFATGRFDEAAGATQAAMHRLPREQWGLVVNHYAELYGKTHDYTSQLRALESAIKDKPNDPALRFLAGFHYAYLGFTRQALDQLDRGLKAAPRDEMARQLRDEMRSRIEKPAAAPEPGGPGRSSGPALLSEPDSD